MMKERNLAESTTSHYFSDPAKHSSKIASEGTREMLPLYPFVIAGGRNTERLYVQHISDITSYKFNVIPRYFGNESNYHLKFPQRIEEILERNNNPKIFCLFDFDTIYDNEQNKANYTEFKDKIKEHIKNRNVVLCPTMPCIEYWFLLHFENNTALFKTNADVVKVLKEYMSSYFSVNSTTSVSEFATKLKKEKYLRDKDWVEKLCSAGKLETAITRAKENIEKAEQDKNIQEQSYTYVYKLFDEYDISESFL